MLRAHKIRLYPNKEQATYLAKACGVARFAYNWALAKAKEEYEADNTVKFNEARLRKELNAIKRDQFPWMLEVTKCAPQSAIKDGLNRAFRNFFAKSAGFPKFHKKGVNDSFSVSDDQFKIDGLFVRLPKLKPVRLAEELRFQGKILGAAVSRTADKWFMAIQVEMPDISTQTSENQAVGVDLGVKALATLSDGTVIIGSKASRKHEKKLRRLNKALSRKIGAKKGEKKSANFIKTKKQILRLYARMADIRSDETHKLTTMLTRNYGVIGTPDLNVKGMMSNHKLARSVADMSFFEFRRQLEYKAETNGVKIVAAGRWFPSSKTCSSCGGVKSELPLSERTYSCECGFACDRDVNAAINLRNYAAEHAVQI
jgi:putative transposase